MNSVTNLEPVSLNEWQKVQASPGVPQRLPRTYLHIQGSYIIFLVITFSDLPVTPRPQELSVSEYDARIMEMTHLQLDSLTQKGNTLPC